MPQYLPLDIIGSSKLHSRLKVHFSEQIHVLSTYYPGMFLCQMVDIDYVLHELDSERILTFLTMI